MSKTVNNTAAPEIKEALTGEEMEKELARLRQSNNDKYTAIVRDQGRIEPASIMALRFETFLDTFLSEEDRLSFELNFESRFGNQLNVALAQMRQAKIMQGTNVNPLGLVIPGK